MVILNRPIPLRGPCHPRWRRSRLCKLGKDLHFDIEELKEKLPGAKAIVFSNPSNPNGIVHTKHELEELGKLLEGSSTLVISDEAYSSLTYSGHDFTSAFGRIPRARFVQTFSKKYAMTGWRVGYVAGDKELIAAIAQFHLQRLAEMRHGWVLQRLRSICRIQRCSRCSMNTPPGAS